jgi:RsiW-degrading membrane proteinase PrsW (M82 family)
MNPDSFIRLAVSLLPVFLFLAALIFLDSYRLVRFRLVVSVIAVGCISAGFCFIVNSSILSYTGLERVFYSRYCAPVVEELVKSLYLIYLIKMKRVGFMVDGAIIGFAIGAGFSLVENIYYMESVRNANILIWMMRGFGTAIMHGGATSIIGIIFKNVSDRISSGKSATFVPGFLVAVLLHSFYNHFVFGPVVNTVLITILLPTAMIVVFQRSENSLRQWLSVSFDSDQELWDMLTSGVLMETPVGQYLHSLQAQFKPEVVADMVCYLQIRVELSIEAKGILLMRQVGFELSPDPTVKEKFAELRFLKKNLGQTGKLALSPLLHTSQRELWQLHTLRAN